MDKGMPSKNSQLPENQIKIIVIVSRDHSHMIVRFDATKLVLETSLWNKGVPFQSSRFNLGMRRWEKQINERRKNLPLL